MRHFVRYVCSFWMIRDGLGDVLAAAYNVRWTLRRDSTAQQRWESWVGTWSWRASRGRNYDRVSLRHWRASDRNGALRVGTASCQSSKRAADVTHVADGVHAMRMEEEEEGIARKCSIDAGETAVLRKTDPRTIVSETFFEFTRRVVHCYCHLGPSTLQSTDLSATQSAFVQPPAMWASIAIRSARRCFVRITSGTKLRSSTCSRDQGQGDLTDII